LTPAIAPPVDYSPPTASATTVLPLPSLLWPDVDTVDGSYFPGGIDYDRWTEVVRPAPRGAFADRLDLLDVLDED
jgi:hypothetical protein